MTDIEWGADIAVDGVRPEWLDGNFWYRSTFNTTRWYGPVCGGSGWKYIEAIRLPADHPYYAAVSRGFTYWPGGESAPADWDGGEVLVGDGGSLFDPLFPDWAQYSVNKIIGYRKRTEQPAPAIAPELVERMVALLREIAKDGKEAKFEGYGVYFAARKILDALNPEDPDLTLAKSIVGDAEAIALAIKAARENAK